MMKVKEFKILSEQQEQHPFSWNCVRSNLALSKWIRDSSVWHILIQRNDSKLAVSWNEAGMNNADSKWVINMNFMFINLPSDTLLGAFSNLCLLILQSLARKYVPWKVLSHLENLLWNIYTTHNTKSASPPQPALLCMFFIISALDLLMSCTLNLPFKISFSADRCLLLNNPLIPCHFLPQSTYLWAAVSYHSITFFLQGFLPSFSSVLPSELLSAHQHTHKDTGRPLICLLCER